MPGASEDSEDYAPPTSFPPRPPFPVNEVTTGPTARQRFQITLIPRLGCHNVLVLQAGFLGVIVVVIIIVIIFIV